MNVWTARAVSSAVKVRSGMASGQLVIISTTFNRYLNPSGDVVRGPILSIATISKGLVVRMGCYSPALLEIFVLTTLHRGQAAIHKLMS